MQFYTKFYRIINNKFMKNKMMHVYELKDLLEKHHLMNLLLTKA